MTLPAAVATLFAVALFCAALSVFWLLRARRQRAESMLLQRLQVRSPDGHEKFTRQVADLGGFLSGRESVRRLSVSLQQAGMTISPVGYLAVSGALVFLALVLATIVSGTLLSGVFLALIAAAGSFFYLSRRRDQRLRAIDTQLPRGLELMMISLRASHTLEDSIDFAAGELAPPISEELRRVYEEYEVGRPIEVALTNLAQRLAPCKALGLFVESVLILKQTGGNLIESLEQIIDGLRAQAAFEVRFRALTSEGRTSGMIIGALPVLLVAAIMLVQPSYLLALGQSSSGRWLATGSATLWLLGILWLARLVRISA